MKLTLQSFSAKVFVGTSAPSITQVDYFICIFFCYTVYMHYYDNPRGMIPAVVVNWAAKTGVPAFLSTLEEACKNYQNSLK